MPSLTKGTTTVVLNIEDKIEEGQTQVDNREHYRPLVNPVVEETNLRFQGNGALVGSKLKNVETFSSLNFETSLLASVTITF